MEGGGGGGDNVAAAAAAAELRGQRKGHGFSAGVAFFRLPPSLIAIYRSPSSASLTSRLT